jgi:DNA-binding NarL/FixJ family response regulator
LAIAARWDCQALAKAADGEEACELCDKHSPDVLILDLRMTKKDGLQVRTELMSSRVPEPRIIVMTAFESEEDIRPAVALERKGE